MKTHCLHRPWDTNAKIRTCSAAGFIKTIKHVQREKAHQHSHSLRRTPSTAVWLLADDWSAKMFWVRQRQLIQSLRDSVESIKYIQVFLGLSRPWQSDPILGGLTSLSAKCLSPFRQRDVRRRVFSSPSSNTERNAHTQFVNLLDTTTFNVHTKLIQPHFNLESSAR